MLVIDLANKNLKENGKDLIKNGIPQKEYQIDPTPVTWEELETYYHAYKYSMPNGVKYRRNYFKALDFNELDTISLIDGENRTKAKEKLELALLTGILNKSLTWPDKRKWFWQSSKDKDFIILRAWFEPNK